MHIKSLLFYITPHFGAGTEKGHIINICLITESITQKSYFNQNTG